MTAFRDRALLHLIDHGLRASEIQGLNVEDYDGQRVHIQEAQGLYCLALPFIQTLLQERTGEHADKMVTGILCSKLFQCLELTFF